MEKEQRQKQLDELIAQIHEQKELQQKKATILQWVYQSGMDAIDVDGRGSCLFLAVAPYIDIPSNVSDQGDYLRQLACDYMEENPHLFKHSVLGVTYDDFVRMSRLSKTFADNQLIVALSAVLGRRFHIYEHVGQSPYEIMSEGIDPSGPSIPVCRVDERHYMSLLPRGQTQVPVSLVTPVPFVGRLPPLPSTVLVTTLDNYDPISIEVHSNDVCEMLTSFQEQTGIDATDRFLSLDDRITPLYTHKTLTGQGVGPKSVIIVHTFRSTRINSKNVHMLVLLLCGAYYASLLTHLFLLPLISCRCIGTRSGRRGKCYFCSSISN